MISMLETIPSLAWIEQFLPFSQSGRDVKGLRPWRGKFGWGVWSSFESDLDGLKEHFLFVVGTLLLIDKATI